MYEQILYQLLDAIRQPDKILWKMANDRLKSIFETQCYMLIDWEIIRQIYKFISQTKHKIFSYSIIYFRRYLLSVLFHFAIWRLNVSKFSNLTLLQTDIQSYTLYAHILTHNLFSNIVIPRIIHFIFSSSGAICKKPILSPKLYFLFLKIQQSLFHDSLSSK